jgi:hypothetical protein
MKRLVLGLAMSVAVLGASLPAMAQPPYPPMPRDRYERPIPPPPGPHGRFILERGHWQWDGARYVWIGGRWIERRAEYRQFVPGHWERRGGAWVWNEAHWR